MKKPLLLIFLLLILHPLCVFSLEVGADVLLSGQHDALLKGKRIGLITNHTAINSQRRHTIDLLKAHAKKKGFTIVALFAPEHGIKGDSHASEDIKNETDPDGVPIYSLHGATRRPTKEMLQDIDLLLYDIQDIGSRSYTFVSTLFYAMEEAAKSNIPVVVLDRPNPINGLTVDGCMMEEKWRSIVGYINVPYCHGMTVGELASYFNDEYKTNCKLHIIPMRGWKRSMTFEDTDLTWIPTSPNIPEASTPWFYPATGILGELQIVSIGIGYTLPFKVVGAPWINAEEFADKLNAQKSPGVTFIPFHFKPFSGKFAQQPCQGVLLTVSDPKAYKPVQTQYLLIGMLKSLYPSPFHDALERSKERRDMFAKVNGTDDVYRIISEERYVVWPLKTLHKAERQAFLKKRQTYLIPAYS
ncbi:MAG: DUF1343 domain-containing protein [Chlamydiales bacterium]|nr:DUF1343 domain-containing protein [Chlamydiales bacterium]